MTELLGVPGNMKKLFCPVVAEEILLRQWSENVIQHAKQA
jgi:hypothetical protein